MAMVVDKAGRDGAAGGVDRLARGTRQFADLDDLAVLDPDIAAEGRHARAVDHQAVLDQQIIRHRLSPRARLGRGATGSAVPYHAISPPKPRFPSMDRARAIRKQPLSRTAGEGGRRGAAAG